MTPAPHMGGGEAAASMPLAKRLARLLLGEYELYAVYGFDLSRAGRRDLSPLERQGFSFRPITREDVSAAADEGLRARAHYAGEGADSFGVFHEGDLVCAQFYWHGERYRNARNFWPLADDEAKSVEFYTVPRLRGRGLGPAIKAYSAQAMKAKGFRRIFSRVWHSHTASRRANEKAGWKHVATVIHIYPLNLEKRIRLVRRHRSAI
ncbi:GNAT family N-acetyltransferase [Caenispirillum salinarum]|uniref:GNAT family N-acetyltransferase n=1 Tax=Caenispirillum salinarum TaxID=859058 RepID=UPI00384A8145